MLSDAIDFLLVAWPNFCFGYPFVMAWYWMAGGILFYLTRERTSAAAAGSGHRRVAADQHPGAVLQRSGQRRRDAVGGPRRGLSGLRGHRHQRRQPRRHGRGARSARRPAAEAAGRPSRARIRARPTRSTPARCWPGTSCSSASTATRCSIRRRSAGSPARSGATPSARSPATRASAIAARCWGACRSASSRRSSASSAARRPCTAGSSPCPACSARFASGAGTGGLVVVAHAHRRHRRHLAPAARGLARRL